MGKGLKIAGGVFGGFILLFLLLAAIGGNGEPAASPEPTSAEIAEEPTPEPKVEGSETATATVAKVIDGDTIQLDTGEVVRYIGIDAPERQHPSKPVECLNEEATTKNRELVEGKEVRLEKDKSEVDRYDRLLRYVYIGDAFVNDLLVREGFAQAKAYKPDIQHQALFDEAQREAKEKEWGIWSHLCQEEPTQPNVAGTTAESEVQEPESTPESTQTTTQPAPKQAAPKPTKAAAPNEPAGLAPAVHCSGNTYNCGDFNSCAEVMAVFNACSTDIHKLDQDSDGVPCESLCG